MNCPNCGYYLPDGSTACPNCGVAFGQQTGSRGSQQGQQYQQQYQQQNQQQYQQQYRGQYGANNPYAGNPMIKNEIETSKGLGIASIVCAVVGFRLVGLILGIVGGSKIKRVLPMCPNDFSALDAKKYCKIGTILSAVMIGLGIFGAIASIVITIIYGAAAFGAFSGLFGEEFEEIIAEFFNGVEEFFTMIRPLI